MNLERETVTINRGVTQKAFGALIVIAGLLAAAAGGHGAVQERWRLIGCLALVLFGLLLISPTDRLKLDFANRRYVRVYGWAPLLTLRAGSFDELEGISIRQASRGAGEGGGQLSRVLFLNWTQDLPPYELASFDEGRSYNGADERITLKPGANQAGVVGGAEAADLRAESFRERFGFHRVGG
jgi:hypothetical protein